METQPAPRTIHLETQHYIVRTLEPADATESWGQWLTDPMTARNLNAQPQRMTVETLQAYVKGFNRTTAHLIGTFEKETARLIAIRSIYIDWKIREFLANILVGQSSARNQGVLSETHPVVYGYFFDTLDLFAARASVVSTNTVMLDWLNHGGWIQERTTRKAAADGKGFVEIRHFRLPRDVWRQRQIEIAHKPVG